MFENSTKLDVVFSFSMFNIHVMHAPLTSDQGVRVNCNRDKHE